MSTALCPIANHNIDFAGKSFEELTREILGVLNRFQLPDEAFVIDRNLSDEATQVEIQKARNKKWFCWEEGEYYTYAKDKRIEIQGPFDLHLTFYFNKIEFWPGLRYYHWFEMEETWIRDGWRKYFYAMVKALGGDRVIYLADNSHHLESFMYEEIPFEQIEAKLRNKYGEPKQSWAEVAKDFDNAYYIDFFMDISNL
jgi:hypothetical protein